MDIEKIVGFFESSFLRPLLIDEEITDISFNGKDLFYVHNFYGRQRSDISVEDNAIKDFIRQIANLCERQFSYQSPVLDVSFGKYRFNAIHQTIGKKNSENVLTFSIRIASYKPRINDDSDFLDPALVELFEVLLASHTSMVIGGVTGCGKTEFQKYLIRKMESNCRVIVIDNVLELDNLGIDNRLDLQCWQVDDNNPNASIQLLVRNALRSNPDWLIVAESRGAEMIELLNAVMTGHPIITTIHSYDADSIPNRMTSMVMMNDKKIGSDHIIKDIYHHFHFYIYLKKEMDENGNIRRYISSILYRNELGKKVVMYKNENNVKQYKKLNKKALKFLIFNETKKNFIEKFVVGSYEK